MKGMKTILGVVGILAFVSTALATPVNIQDGFNYDAATYTSRWSSLGGRPLLSQEADWVVHEGSTGLRGYPAADEGMQAQLSTLDANVPVGGGVEMDPAGASLTFSIYFRGEVNNTYKSTFMIEMYGTDGSYYALKNGYDYGNNSVYFYNGSYWDRCNGSTFTTAHRRAFLEIKTNGDVAYGVVGSATETQTGLYTGGVFETVTIRSPNAGTNRSAGLDYFELVGGEIVVPEPATLALLGFGCFFLRRRRS